MKRINAGRNKYLKGLLIIGYYLSFLWVSLLLLAEIMVLFTSNSILYKFLGTYFFSMATWIALVFILFRFVYMVVADSIKRRKK